MHCLSQLVDSSVILYRMGTTHRKAISRTLKILNENNADPVGIVANGLPPMKSPVDIRLLWELLLWQLCLQLLR